jgi:signal transduction histidine kinase
MSHEIRVPMNAVLGLAHVPSRSPLPPAQSDQVKKLRNAGEHLLGIINDILDLSKIEAGKLAVDGRDFSVAAVFEGVKAFVDEEARKKDVNVQGVVDGDPTAKP